MKIADRPLRVLIGCEESGTVQKAFAALGHDTYSCDLKPTRGDPSRHYHCDLFEAVADGPWDLGIFFPDCTFLANSGSKHLYRDCKFENGVEPARWTEMLAGAVFFNRILQLKFNVKNPNGVRRVVVENPLQHCHARKLIRKYNQIIQPWQYGHREMKATCLWLDGVPRLAPTDVVGPPPHRSDRAPRVAEGAPHGAR